MAISPKTFLRNDIVLEPLVDRWYAWSHLISPATAARNLTERHLKIMASYGNAPQFHAMATKNPRFAGGPFISYGRDRSTEVLELAERTGRERVALTELSRAIATLDTLLRERSNGGPLSGLYRELPAALDGLVELHYDRAGRPDFRLIEPLLYRAHRDYRQAQSLLLRPPTTTPRPFILSTPYLPEEGEALLRLPFDDPGVEQLFAMLRAPQTFAEIAEALGLDESQQAIFLPFFTEQPPPPPLPWQAPPPRWRYFGHACVLLETPDCTIMVDPIINHARTDDLASYTFSDLPDRLDFVLITHNHQDHVVIETLLRLRDRIGRILVPRAGAGLLADPSLRLMLEQIGFDEVLELDDFQSITVGETVITATPFLGEHGDLSIRSKATWHVHTAGKSVLFAADCRNISPALFQRIRETIGQVGVLFLGMECDGAPMSWVYGPLLTTPIVPENDKGRRLAGSDFDEAAALVATFEPKEVFVYAMGMESWLNFIVATHYSPHSHPMVASARLVESCRAHGLVAERLYGAKESRL